MSSPPDLETSLKEETTDWTPVRLPFLRPSSQLPAPLPSEKEFLESTRVFKNDASHHRVVAVGPHFIVKHGLRVSENEGQALLFLEKHANPFVAVPKLYAMYRVPSTGHLCLIMELMGGESLEELWPTLEDDEKLAICTKLKDAFNFIRRIPSASFYGGVGRTHVPHHLFYDRGGDRALCGPFDSESEFNTGLVKKLRALWAHNGMHMSKVDFYERNLDNVLKRHDPVFSHSDLQRKNILVCGGTRQKTFKVAVIDWEDAGWYPSYWEYCSQFVTLQWTDDWPRQLEQIIDPWPCEAAVLRMLYQELWF